MHHKKWVLSFLGNYHNEISVRKLCESLLENGESTANSKPHIHESLYSLDIVASGTHCSSDRRLHILFYLICCLSHMQPFSFFSFLVSWIMIISRICFKLKYLHPLEYKPRLYIAFRKFWFNNKLGQLWLGVLNRSTYDCSYKFCQKCWAQWTGQDYGKCVCQSLLQGQNKVGLALLQSHTP